MGLLALVKNIVDFASFVVLYERVKEATKEYDSSHDAFHAVRMYNNMLRILERNGPQYDKNGVLLEWDMEFIVYIGLFHDVVDYKYEGKGINKQQLESMLINDLGETKAKRVMDVIDNISFSKRVKGLTKDLGEDNRYLDLARDADLLEALGPIGIERCIEYNRVIGGKLPEDVVTHCHDKLLRICPHEHDSDRAHENYIVNKGAQLIVEEEQLHQAIVNYVSANSG